MTKPTTNKMLVKQQENNFYQKLIDIWTRRVIKENNCANMVEFEFRFGINLMNYLD